MRGQGQDWSSTIAMCSHNAHAQDIVTSCSSYRRGPTWRDLGGSVCDGCGTNSSHQTGAGGNAGRESRGELGSCTDTGKDPSTMPAASKGSFGPDDLQRPATGRHPQSDEGTAVAARRGNSKNTW